ncbi:N-acetyltransferase family protein [Luteimonas sp. BDR2-5]|uniref:GNAT family N-acetyltransferase n=1 Tax=Proluteimonas luteida TaxID=2878685 RepID=UPI001E4D3ACC|nr:GNAT family N-acetyltransferase [Luteimonas sp. BDR2-5]MCD9026968.1 N-acetyltransferase family protein [Luteimonas sp. BDR2-5]
MEIRVRDAVDADFDAITALYAHEVAHDVATYEYDAPDAVEMRRRWQAVRDAGCPWLVAESDGRFAGYAYAGGYRSRIGYRWTVESTVYVVHALHGHGIGRLLMQHLIDDCTRRDFRQMVAVIGEPANAPSVRLHERLGFTTIGIFPGLGRKHGRWLDTLQMQRALGDGAGSPPDDEPAAAAVAGATEERPTGGR